MSDNKLVAVTCKITQNQNDKIDDVSYGANRAENFRLALELLIECDEANIPLNDLRDYIASGDLTLTLNSRIDNRDKSEA